MPRFILKKILQSAEKPESLIGEIYGHEQAHEQDVIYHDLFDISSDVVVIFLKIRIYLGII
ncbi:MAG: hypothetical protein A2751_02175 [Candidatus Doudnabacteria bacterium RIFCSPHIGHO2_01_FULL_46_14]|uniref:Uncharacterized protein n=1 Tax=Candidatus Doudnabacteria bacterium RIFCSPHIGHO2_01_FULL_46_14 TaxID=1817824 RepID=A0A1F5NJV4_9BACT|nr:MAG: hypothetical protein A2751_02175 [Candidatus Doudnabacteria bacterium RIFCSPHIGHO2_01_FULL_46_14]